MSEAIVFDDCEDPNGPMSKEELLAVMANGSVASQIRLQRSLLGMVFELPPNKRGSQIEDISARIVSLETEYNDLGSPTWQKYAKAPTDSQEANKPTGFLDRDSVIAFIEKLTSEPSLEGKQLAELYELSDALAPILEGAQQRLLDEIDDREQAALRSSNTVNLSLVPDLPVVCAEHTSEPDEYEALMPATVFAGEESSDVDSAETLPPVDASELEPRDNRDANNATVPAVVQESFIITDDFRSRLLDYLSTGPATHREILCGIFGIVQPEIHEISIILRTLTQMVGVDILQDERNHKFFIPYSGSPKVDSSINPKSAPLPTGASSGQKRKRKVTRTGGSWK